MKDNNIFYPILRTLDKVIFGIEEEIETEKRPEFVEMDDEEEFDVDRTNN